MISIFVRTILIYIILSIMMKIMGKRQIGELEVNELVSTLLISEIAAIPISDTDISLLPAIIPILFITSLEVVISTVKNKSALAKRIVEGEPVYIIYRGELRQKVLKDNRLSINEILTEMRIQGIGDISEVYYGILEQNGKLSLLKKTPSENLAVPVIIDCAIDDKNLEEAGYTRKWLNERLIERNLIADGIFLMTVDDKGYINIILKEENT